MSSGGIWDPIREFTRPIEGDRDGRFEGDTIRVGGDYCPGLAIPRRAGDPRMWDKRPGYGLSGASLIYKGDDLSQFSVDVSCWTQTQIDEFKIFFQKWLKRQAPKNTPDANGFLPIITPKALGIYHPALAILGISAVQVADVTQFEQIADGLWGCSIELIVWRPPLHLLFKPNGKIPDVPKKTPSARDAAEELIKKKLEQIDKLENSLARTPP